MSDFDNNSNGLDPMDFVPESQAEDQGQPEAVETVEQDTQTTEGKEDNQQVDSQTQEPEVEEELPYTLDENGNYVLSPEAYNGIVGEKDKATKQYKNLQPQFTRVSQELSELRKASQNPQQAEGQQGQSEVAVLPEGMGVIPQVPANKPGVNPSVGKITDIVNSYVEARLAPLTEQMREKESETTISRKVVALERANPEEFDDVMPAAQEYLVKHPELWKLGEEAALDIAYSSARGEVLKAAIAREIEDGVKNRESRKQYKDNLPKDKSRAQNNQGSKRKPSEEIADSIVSMAHSSNVGAAFRS